MIYRIKNPWVRRTLLVVLVPFAFLFELFFRMYDAAKDMASDVRDCWRGLSA